MAERAGALIDDEVASFLQGPVSAFLGTADAGCTPDATRIIGIAPIAQHRLRVLISERSVTARSNAVIGAKVAVLVTDITNYRSIQWKGRVIEVGASRSPGDRVLIDHHLTTFAASSAIVGIDPAEAWRIFPLDGVPVVLELDECFDQTPGPMAGQQLEMRP